LLTQATLPEKAPKELGAIYLRLSEIFKEAADEISQQEEKENA
jgi:hypothetical protein